MKRNGINTAICKIENGKYKGKFIFLEKEGIVSESESESDDDDEIMDIPFDYDELKKHDLMKPYKGNERKRKIAKVRNFLSGKRSRNRKMDDFTRKAKKIRRIITKKEIKLGKGDGRIKLIPNTKEREVLYVGGKSGMGKSWLAGEYSKKYKKMYPDNPIYMFSRKKEDPSIDQFVDVERFDIDDDLVNDPIDFVEELVADNDGCLVIFDDCNTLQDKKIKEACLALQNDCLEVGRDKKVNMVVTSHKLSDHKNTKTILSECHYIIVNPSAAPRVLQYTLSEHVGLSNKQINRIKKLKKKTRWVAIYKDHPTHVIYEKGAYICEDKE